MLDEWARRETIRYHERLYGERELFAPGSWLASPARFILGALEVIQPAGKTTVLDLGCGVGRHAIPIAKQFGPSATVHCVDLLASAVGRLREYAMRYGVADQITSEVCDLENLVLAHAAYDAVVCCSCLEHMSSTRAVRVLLENAVRATRPGGVHALMVGVGHSRVAIDSGEPLQTGFELSVDRSEFDALLRQVYSGWEFRLTSKTWDVEETFAGAQTRLKSLCMMVCARSPGVAAGVSP